MPTSARPPHPWSTADPPLERYTDDPTPPFLLSTAQLLSPDALRPVAPASRPYSDNPRQGDDDHPSFDPYDDKDPLILPTPMPGLYDASGNLLPDPAEESAPLNPPRRGLDDEDPIIQTNALAPYAFGLQNQKLVKIPYRPMEPRLRRWAKSEIAPEDVVIPLLLITFQTG
jgi:hypothetical protein